MGLIISGIIICKFVNLEVKKKSSLLRFLFESNDWMTKWSLILGVALSKSQRKEAANCLT